MLSNLRKHLAVSALMAFVASAFAAQQPYDRTQFQATLAAGKPAVVYFHASWCVVCHVQQPIVDRLAASPEMKNLTVFVADYDKEKALRKTLRVSEQSTFVVFKEGKEVARSTGQTQEQEIRSVWKKAL